jgi:hypothetical protein
MGGSFSGAVTRGRRGTHTLVIAALALVAFALAAGSAAAQPAAVRVPAAGITTPSGVAITPDGDVWISDELYGLCHVSASGLDIDGDVCAPEPVEPVVPPVPEGTPEPPAPPETRPGGTGQIAFDDATDNFYAAEGTSGGSGVWRMHWNAATGRIDADSVTKIYDSFTRVQGLALTPTGDLVFSDKETSAIYRLLDPATTPRLGPNAGFSIAGGSSSLAVLGGTVYIADGGSLTELTPTGTGVATPVAGQPVPVEGVDTGIAAVAADPVRGVVYAGTATPELTDAVLSFKDGVMSPAAYDRGFTNITAMTVGPAGGLYVVQDPNGALSPGTDPTGQAELYLKAYGPLVAPEAVLKRWPRAATQDTRPTFLFDALYGTDTTRFECRFDTELVDCPGGEFTPAADLAEGLHRFSVRATNVPEATDADWGRSASYAFRVDHTAPTVTIDEPSAHTAPGGKLRLFFSADEAGVAFTCQVDDKPAAGCDAPRDFTLAEGDHTITVRATDDALNAGAPVTWNVTTTPALPAPPATPATPAKAAPPAVATTTTAAPIAVTPQPRVPRIEIGVACEEVSARRASARLSLSGRSAIVRFRAPAAARYAKFTMRKRTGGRVVETLAYAKVARAGATHTTRIALTRGQRRLVRSGANRLAVAYGTCRTQVGQWQWIPTSTTEGSR